MLWKLETVFFEQQRGRLQSMIPSIHGCCCCLNDPFSLDASLTCHTCIPYRTPIQTCHLVAGQFIYCRNGSSSQLPCPSSNKNGFSPFSLFHRSCLSICFSISTRILLVMLALGEQATKQAIHFPLYKQVGPPCITLFVP